MKINLESHGELSMSLRCVMGNLQGLYNFWTSYSMSLFLLPSKLIPGIHNIALLCYKHKDASEIISSIFFCPLEAVRCSSAESPLGATLGRDEKKLAANSL